MKTIKLAKGQEVTINIPFTYTIGEEGFFTDKVMETIEDCKADIVANIKSECAEDFQMEVQKETNVLVTVKGGLVESIHSNVVGQFRVYDMDLEENDAEYVRYNGTSVQWQDEIKNLKSVY